MFDFPIGDVVTSGFQNGVRDGDAVIISPRSNLARLVGTYEKGQLEGRGRVVDSSTQVTDCFFHRSCLHGPARKFTMKKFREFRQQLDFIGTYRCGKPYGMCWNYQEGGGYLVGKVDPKTGEFTSDGNCLTIAFETNLPKPLKRKIFFQMKWPFSIQTITRHLLVPSVREKCWHVELHIWNL